MILIKYYQNETRKRSLLKTNDKVIAEASPSDTFFGVGHGLRDTDLWRPSAWRGRNVLGQMLALVRNQLRQQNKHDFNFSQSKSILQVDEPTAPQYHTLLPPKQLDNLPSGQHQDFSFSATLAATDPITHDWNLASQTPNINANMSNTIVSDLLTTTRTLLHGESTRDEQSINRT